MTAQIRITVLKLVSAIATEHSLTSQITQDGTNSMENTPLRLSTKFSVTITKGKYDGTFS